MRGGRGKKWEFEYKGKSKGFWSGLRGGRGKKETKEGKEVRKGGRALLLPFLTKKREE